MNKNQYSGKMCLNTNKIGDWFSLSLSLLSSGRGSVSTGTATVGSSPLWEREREEGRETDRREKRVRKGGEREDSERVQD